MREGSDPAIVEGLLGAARERPGPAQWRPRSTDLVEAMARCPDRRFATTYERELTVWVEPERARTSAWYELFPRSTGAGHRHRHAARRDRTRPAVRRRAGLRRPVPAARSIRSARRSARARTTTWSGEPGRSRQPVGDRLGGRRAHRDPPRPRHARGLRAPGAPRRRARASRWRSTSRSSARPTTRGSREHPEWFRAPPRRHDPVRREPAQEVPGHLPARLRDRGLARRCGRAARACSCSGSSHGVRDLPRRQPPHEAVRVLGVADRRGASASTPT